MIAMRASFRFSQAVVSAVAAAVVIATAAIVGGVAAVPAPALAADPPKPAALFTVPFEILPSNHMAIKVKINGKGPYRLVFDVGAPITVISNKAAFESGVTKKEGLSFFLAAAEHKVQSLEVSGAKVDDLPVLVLDHPVVKALSTWLRPLHGIVGYTFFARYRTTIDYQAKTMTLEPVSFKATNLTEDLAKRLAGPKVQKTQVFAPQGLWGLVVADSSPLDAKGVAITAVKAGSPAEKAGIQAGDALAEVDGRWTTSGPDVYEAASKADPSKPVAVVLDRNGKEIRLRIQPSRGF